MKTYTYDEVRRESITYFKGDELAAEVFAGKYALRDAKSQLYELTPADMHRRLAREFARVENKYPNPMSESEIYDLLSSWKVVPQGSPMSAVGNPHQYQSLSNCFVIESPQDSYGGILRADQEQAQIMKRRGGVGFDVSTIRPRGLTTSNAARTTDGIGVFMERFSNTCREVAQGGRRGALMLTISVHHPEIRTFINIKRDLKKVTGANISIRLSDEFMNAVKDNTDVELRFPVEKDVPHTISEHVSAVQLWDEIIEAAHHSAEPGLLFWDTVTRMGPADAYASVGYGSTSTNPCLTGDTMVSVADGRGFVSFKQLADEGKDVPVYSVNDDGKLIIKTMRNPRLTGTNVPIMKVTIEGGHTFKATPNHKMILRDGTRKRVDELVEGDQLSISKRSEKTLVEMGSVARSNNPNHYVMIENHQSSRSEHRMIWEFHNGQVPKGYVIHHRDFNSKNNSLENLECMDFFAHRELHAAFMRGENNPIFKIKADPVRFAAYSAKMSKSVGGENNPRAYDVTQDEFIQHVETLTTQLGRRVTRAEWQTYAQQHKLPVWPNVWRSNGKSFYQFTIEIAKKYGYDNHVNVDARVLRTLDLATSQGYVADIIDDVVIVERECEWCHKPFSNEYSRREIAFCSHSCSNLYANRKEGKNEVRKASLQAMHAQKAVTNRKAILDAFTELRFKLNRIPLQDELRQTCKEKKVSYRTGTKNGFKNFDDIKQQASLHNHRVVSVEACGSEDVYNGTVDDNHTFIIGGWEIGNNERLQLDTQNCGEITLSPYDSCRLLLVNLYAFVKQPFSKNASFDYDDFFDTVYKAQKLMDDLVDLELEAVDAIIHKIESDPETDEVKRIELQLWHKIKKAAAGGRRTGLGITALGDALAAVNVRYGSPESVAETDRIYKTQATAAYRSTVDMAQHRGAFPVFSHELEKGHPFIERILECSVTLRADYEKYGRRNIALTTTAPAGSVSILTQTTSGCEPVFMLFYKRRRKITANDGNARVDFVDEMGDKWQEYMVYHHAFKKWMDVTGLTEVDVEKSPYWGATSNDIDWVRKIDVQAAAQKWICHSISNTTNIPNATPVEVVKQIYMHGWVTGCKGVTIYRDGSRAGVLVNNDKPEEAKLDEAGQPLEILETHAPKRPKELPCDIHRATVKGETYMVLVGLHNDRPYEIFCGLQEHVEVPKKIKSGTLIKNGKVGGVATYNLKIPLGDDDELVFKNIVELFDNPIYGALTRTISLALRHGVPLQYLIEQLRKDKHSDIMSFSAVVARVLSKHYIPDGTKVTTEKVCNDCGGVNLQYIQGCVTCFDCGQSRCN
jgi:ribonucleotide reductase alpha subunit